MHKLMQSGIKISPHVRIQMNTADTFGMVRRLNAIGHHERPTYAVEKHVLHVKKLSERVAEAA